MHIHLRPLYRRKLLAATAMEVIGCVNWIRFFYNIVSIFKLFSELKL